MERRLHGTLTGFPHAHTFQKTIPKDSLAEGWAGTWHWATIPSAESLITVTRSRSGASAWTYGDQEEEFGPRHQQMRLGMFSQTLGMAVKRMSRRLSAGFLCQYTYNWFVSPPMLFPKHRAISFYESFSRRPSSNSS